MMEGYVLIIREPSKHPNSVLERLKSTFDSPSIVIVSPTCHLSQYRTKPVFGTHYLVIFNSFRDLSSSVASIKFDYMFPVYSCSSEAMELEAKHLLDSKGIKYKIYRNAFVKDDAVKMVMDLAAEPVTKTFAEKLVSRVGLSPTRIIGAMVVLEHVGYTQSNINKYIDKYVYVDHTDVLAVLLGQCKSKAQYARAIAYLQLWYPKYPRDTLVKELDFYIKVYKDIMSGDLTDYSLDRYLDDNAFSRWRVLEVIDLYSKISIVRLMQLRAFLNKASLLEMLMIFP